MSYADKVFIDMCRDIIDNGVSTEEKVRPKMGGRQFCLYIEKILCGEPI